MKILAIRGCNLASIEGEFEIDFTTEPLRSAGLFAITGHTGSGKSTILDSLCLALYAKTPRSEQSVERVAVEEKNNIQQNDARLILRKGTGQGWAEVDFRAINGDTYRSRWAVARAHNKPGGNLQHYTFWVKNLSTQTELQGTKTQLIDQLEGLIGLTYDQFTRSVLLAQNEFATFLKAKDNEKAAILEKLTGLEIYSTISKRIFEKYSESRTDLNHIEAQLQGIQLLSETDVLAIQQQQKTLSEEINNLENSTREREAKLKWWQDLSTLNEALKTANETLATAKEKEIKALPRKQYLRKAENSRNIAPEFNQWKNNKEEIVNKQKTCTELKTSMTQINILIEETEQNKNKKTILIQDLEEKRQSIEPQLTAARDMDKRIEIAKTNQNQAKESLSQHLDEISKNKTLLSDLIHRATTLTDAIEHTQQWFNQNRRHASLVQHHSKIITLLDQLTNQQLKIEGSIQRVAQLTRSVEKLRQETGTLKLEQTRQKEAHEAEKLENSKLKKRLDQTDVVQLRLQAEMLQQQKELLTQAQIKWQTLLKSEKEKVKTEQELKELHEQLPKTETELIQVQLLFTEATSERDTAEKLYNNARLASDKVVVNLRASLLPDEPCPVCGSKDHHLEAITDGFLSAFKQQYDNSRQQYDMLSQKQIQLTEHHKTITARIGLLQTSVDAALNQYQTDRSAWETLAKQLTDTFHPEAKIDDTWIETSMTIVGEQLQKQKITEREISNLTEQLQKSQILIAKQKDEMLKMATLLSEQEKQQSSQETELKNETKHRDEGKLISEQLIASIDEIITMENWQTQWHDNNVQLRNNIAGLAHLWQQNEQSKQEREKQWQSINGQQQTLNETIRTQITKEEKLRDADKEANELVSRLTHERKGILEGKDADSVEKEIRLNMTNERGLLETIQQQYIQQKSDFDRQQASIETIQKEIDDKQLQSEKLRMSVLAWCDQQQPVVSIEELTQLISHTAEWFQEEHNQIEIITLEIQKYDAIVKERERQINEHRCKPGIPDAETETTQRLTQIIGDEKEKLANQNNLKAELLARLKNDAENKKRFADIQLRIEKQALITGNWKQLNDILGSNSGDTFRKIAQGYTLDALLQHANQQLLRLTARYRLQRIGDSLALMVIDKDMCEEQRPVLSLSGGESFLISLALALGLSSLASDRISVESLFIDEGFGSLDMETLRSAMEALSNLQTQGRKIGVISHVQEMTEGIAVRVQVEKSGNGSSHIKISAY